MTLKPALSCVLLLASVMVRGADSPPDVSDAGRILDGAFDNKRISLQCRIRDVFRDDVDEDFFYLLLDCGGTTLYANCETTNVTAAIRDFKGFLDCDVALRCIVEPMFSRRIGRRLLHRIMGISSTDDVTVLRRPESAVFDVPDLGERRLHLNEIHFAGPRKVRGTVVARWHGNKILVRTASGASTVVKLRENVLPALYSTVEAVGTPETDLYHVNLIRGRWRPVDGKPHTPSRPAAIPIGELFMMRDNKRLIINTVFHGSVLRVRGMLKNVLVDRDGFRRLLLNEERFNLPVDCSAVPGAPDRLVEGSEIEVTGVCVMESESWRPNTVFPKIRGLFLVPRTPQDIRVLKAPPWWTPMRFAVAFFILLGIVVAVLIWNATLRALVTRKSRQLLKEQTEKLEETLKIGERTRLAAELHDYLAQNLTVISYQVSAARSALTLGSPDTGDYLNTADRMLQSCRTDLRRCLWDLKSDTLNEPDFTKAVLTTVAPVAGDAELDVSLDIRRTLLSDTTAHTVLSILRELTANAVRHGQAGTVKIRGEIRARAVFISIRDDGTGFDPSKRPGQAEGHFGLDGVNERVRHFGGTMEIRSAPGKGTEVSVTLNHEINRR